VYETQIISDPKAFADLRTDWNQLLARSLTNTIFLTWEWISAWWEVFGEGTDIFVVTVRDKAGRLVGAAPLIVRRSKCYRFPVKEMTFIGIGHADQQDFLIVQRDTGIVNQILSDVYGQKQRWDVVRLEQIPSESPLVWGRVNGDFRHGGEEGSSCPCIKIAGSWEEYMKSLSKKFRRDIKHKINRMNRLGKWRFHMGIDGDGLDDVVRSMEQIEAKSRKMWTGNAFFPTNGNRDFVVRLSTLFLEQSWLDYSTILLNDEPVAYLLGFLYNHRYYSYNMAFSDQFREASPGKLLLHEKIKWCFENPDLVREFDFLRGDTYLKRLWTSESRRYSQVIFFNDSLYSNLLKYAAFYVRPKIKRLLGRRR
jgi:CelD/BcsL family acetyltransferase involved in cellulose biosynthesis